LADDFPRIKNFNVAVKEIDNKIIFLRKLKPGGSAHSFGIHVAQIAGMPQPIVLRASEIMQHLEKDHVTTAHKKRVREIPKNNFQLSIFEPADPRMEELKEKINLVDVNTLSPIEA